MGFSEYLDTLNKDQRIALDRIIKIVRDSTNEKIEEGLSYGLPAFKYNDRPLIGFSSNKHGLNIYPFDPKIIDELRPDLKDFELSKGVIRFTPEHQLPEEIILKLLDLRLSYLKTSR